MKSARPIDDWGIFRGIAFLYLLSTASLLKAVPGHLLLFLAILLIPATLFFESYKDQRLNGLMLYWPVFALVWIQSFDQLPQLLKPGIILSFAVVIASGLQYAWTSPKVRPGILWLVLAGAFGCIIAFLSGGKGGADPMLEAFLRWGLDADEASFATHLVRKGIHFSFYGLIALFAAKAYLATRWGDPKAALFGFLWAVPHAIVDEWRQSYEANRSGSIWDVLLDVCGMMVFLSILMVRMEKKKCVT